MAVRRQQAIGNHEAGAGNARAKLRLAAWESDTIHTVDKTNRIAITVQDQRRHGLLLLELLHFVSQLQNLALQVVFLEFALLTISLLKIMRTRARGVAEHQNQANQQADSQHAFEHSLPDGTDALFANL